MGRSVIPHPQATVTAYLEFSSEHYCPECEQWSEEGKCPECGDEIYSCSFVFGCDHAEDWREFVQWVSDTACEFWPSMHDVDARTVSWSSENYVCAENRHSEISISEYCGLVAISLAPRSDLSDHYWEEFQSETLGARWRSQISERFLSTFGTLQKTATASNGESFYERIAS